MISNILKRVIKNVQIMCMFLFKISFGLKIFKPVSFLFPSVSDYANEYCTKEKKNEIGLKIFIPKNKSNHNIYKKKKRELSIILTVDYFFFLILGGDKKYSLFQRYQGNIEYFSPLMCTIRAIKIDSNVITEPCQYIPNLAHQNMSLCLQVITLL